MLNRLKRVDVRLFYICGVRDVPRIKHLIEQFVHLLEVFPGYRPAYQTNA